MIEPTDKREQRIIAAIKIAHLKSIEERKQVYRLAEELYLNYNYSIKQIEEMLNTKL